MLSFFVRNEGEMNGLAKEKNTSIIAEKVGNWKKNLMRKTRLRRTQESEYHVEGDHG